MVWTDGEALGLEPRCEDLPASGCGYFRHGVARRRSTIWLHLATNPLTNIYPDCLKTFGWSDFLYTTRRMESCQLLLVKYYKTLPPVS